MPRRNNNALGKPQGVKKKHKAVSHPEQTEYKTVIVPMSIKNRIDPATIAELKAVFG
jgi:hypothetical protein